MKKNDLKCCGNCFHITSGIIENILVCSKIHCETIFNSVCYEWEYDKKDYESRHQFNN